MQRVISREVQKERDEKDVLDRIVHSAPGKVLGESDSESDNTGTRRILLVLNAACKHKVEPL